MFKFELNEQRKPSDIIQNQYKDPIKNAVWNYVAGYTTSINNLLRKHDNDEMVTREMDEAFKVYGESDVTSFYRTVDWTYMKNIYVLTRNNIDKFIGKTFINRGYMSTSKDFISPWGNNWNEWELVIHITGDTTYIDVNKLFKPEEIDCEEQNELILPRNTILRLESYRFVRNKEKTYLLEMSIIVIF